MRSMLIVLLVFSSYSVLAGETAVFRMPPEENICFKNDCFTGSEYYQFNTNGTYRQVDREHMFVKECDHGTWSQAENGTLTLISEEHYRNIESGPLSIFMWYTQAIERLPWVKTQIDNLLTESNQSSFTKEKIEAIEKYGYQNCLSRVSVDDGRRSIQRDELANLVQQINAFLSDGQKNHFHATPMTYKGHTFLLWADSQTPINRNLDEIKTVIDKLNAEEYPPYIFNRIAPKVFEMESGLTQEFLFYPEMTEKVRQTIILEKEGPPAGN